jgi:hypothetical protein
MSTREPNLENHLLVDTRRRVVGEWLRSLLILSTATVLAAAGCNKQEPTDETSEPPGLPAPAEPSAAAMPGPEAAPQQAQEVEALEGEAQVSDEELQRFAQVQVKLEPLQRQVGEQAQAGGDQDALRAQFHEQASRILAGSGLSPERFNQLGILIQQDPNVQRRFQDALQRKMQDQPPPTPQR